MNAYNENVNVLSSTHHFNSNQQQVTTRKHNLYNKINNTVFQNQYGYSKNQLRKTSYNTDLAKRNPVSHDKKNDHLSQNICYDYMRGPNHPIHYAKTKINAILSSEIVYKDFGEPDVLMMRFRPPHTGEKMGVVVAVEASTISITDCLLRRNMYPDVFEPITLPNCPGVDCVGRIIQTGEKVERYDGWKIGDRVCSLFPFLGGNANTVTLPSRQLVEVPDDVDAAQAACIVRSYLAAYQILHRVGGAKYRLRRSQKVLVTGANGQVGRAVIELAKLEGAEVYAASRPEHKDFIEKVMKARWVDCDPVKWVLIYEEMDVVVDTVCYTGDFEVSLNALKPRSGKLVCVGASRQLMKTIQKQRRKASGFSDSDSDSDSDCTSNFDSAFGKDLDVGIDGLCGCGANAQETFTNFPLSCNISALKAKFLLGSQCFTYDLFKAVDERPADMKKDLEFLFSLLKKRILNPIVAYKVPLQLVGKAHETLERGFTFSGLSPRLTSYIINENTSFQELRSLIEWKEGNGIYCRTMLYMEFMNVVECRPNPLNYSIEERRKYQFGVIKSIKNKDCVDESEISRRSLEEKWIPTVIPLDIEEEPIEQILGNDVTDLIMVPVTEIDTNWIREV